MAPTDADVLVEGDAAWVTAVEALPGGGTLLATRPGPPSGVTVLSTSGTALGRWPPGKPTSATVAVDVLAHPPHQASPSSLIFHTVAGAKDCLLKKAGSASAIAE